MSSGSAVCLDLRYREVGCVDWDRRPACSMTTRVGRARPGDGQSGRLQEEVGEQGRFHRGRAPPTGGRRVPPVRLAGQSAPLLGHVTAASRQPRQTMLAYARGLVEKAVTLEIEVLAVTDHNHVGGVAAIRAAAADPAIAGDRTIHVFPGFELASTEGIHVLCLYPPDYTEEQLGRCLGEFGVRETTASSEVCDKPFSDLLACVRDQGRHLDRGARHSQERAAQGAPGAGPDPRLAGTTTCLRFRFPAGCRTFRRTYDPSSRTATPTTAGNTRRNRTSRSRS